MIKFYLKILILMLQLYCVLFMVVQISIIEGNEIVSTDRPVIEKSTAEIMDIILKVPERGRPESFKKNIMRKFIVGEFIKINPKLSTKSVDKYVDHIFEASGRYDVDPLLVTCIIIKESTVKEAAEWKGNIGMMQVSWRVHRSWVQYQHPQVRKKEDLKIARNGILAGTMILGKKVHTYKNVYKAVMHYNGSDNKIRYADSVHKRYKRYKEKFNKLVANKLKEGGLPVNN